MNDSEQMLKGIQGIDYDSAIRRMSDNTALYAELLRLFFKDSPLKKLKVAIERQDYTSAEYEAHSIKGTAANLGMNDISQMAGKIHLCLKGANFSQAKNCLAELEQACNIVSSIVKQQDGGTINE